MQLESARTAQVSLPPSGQRQSARVVGDDVVFTSAVGRELGRALLAVALSILLGGGCVAALEGDFAGTLRSPELLACAALLLVPLFVSGAYLAGCPERYALLDTRGQTLAKTRWWSGARGEERRTDELVLEVHPIAPGEGEDRWSASVVASDGRPRGFRVLLWTTEVGDPDAAKRAADALAGLATWKGRRTLR